jgi:hypothetical protein
MATRRDVIGAAAGVMTLGARLIARAAPARPSAKVELFGHRGARALWPEHTFGFYARAIADGANYIEPDLVITKDGVLVIRHENNTVETTDVKTRPEFADRKTTKTIDGEKQSGLPKRSAHGAQSGRLGGGDAPLYNGRNRRLFQRRSALGTTGHRRCGLIQDRGLVAVQKCLNQRLSSSFVHRLDVGGSIQSRPYWPERIADSGGAAISRRPMCSGA